MQVLYVCVFSHPTVPWRWKRRRWLDCQTGDWLSLLHTLCSDSKNHKLHHTEDTWWCFSCHHISPYWQKDSAPPHTHTQRERQGQIQRDRWQMVVIMWVLCPDLYPAINHTDIKSGNNETIERFLLSYWTLLLEKSHFIG